MVYAKAESLEKSRSADGRGAASVPEPTGAEGARREEERHDQAFTLLELIVVTAIIGIVAAIAIPQYASYKSRAIDSQMESALKNARTAMEAYYIRNQLYTTDVSLLTDDEYGFSETETVEVVAVPDADFVVDYHLRACAQGGSFDALEFETSGPNAGKTHGVNGVSC